MSFYFGDKRSPELEDAIMKNTLILIPMGTTEEHGRHLPVETDAIIAKEIADRVAQEIMNEIPILVTRPIYFGYSMKEMMRWPGTVRVKTRVVMDMMLDLIGSFIEMGFKKIVVMDCHGHHSGLLKTISRELVDLYDIAIAITSPSVFSKKIYQSIRKTDIGGSIHGGEWETSLMLYLQPELVNMDEATDVDHMKYHSEFIAGDNFSGEQKVTWSTWKLQRSQTGIFGDPTKASAETGKVCVEEIVNNYKKFLREFYDFS
ncbi:MAG: hypothetical protein AMS17_03295 [Spirochaetes bacterium DG_61]|nr:MAG: hypothetical protein AMS17_03295 [Spirochaetes bacterium DG_61]